jgi:hypothetical protein
VRFVAPKHWGGLTELRGSVGIMLLAESDLAELLTDEFHEQVRFELARLRRAPERTDEATPETERSL